MEGKHPSYSNTSDSDQIGEDTCGPFIFRNISPVLEIERSARDDLLKSFNINTSDTPSFPKYATFEERLKSFKDWPHKLLNLAPDVLSAAGLFYTGCKDNTKCFHCGGGLKSWDEPDEPWVEHAHWYPECQYVLSVRGENFVKDVRLKKHEDLDRTKEELKSAIGTLKKIIPKNAPIDESTCTSSRDEVSSYDKSRMMCLICLTEERNTALLPCYHIVACSKCANNLTKCCVCREPIIYRRPVYIP